MSQQSRNNPDRKPVHDVFAGANIKFTTPPTTTPVTDAVEKLVIIRYEQAEDITPKRNAVVAIGEMAHHARSLERELNTAKLAATKNSGMQRRA